MRKISLFIATSLDGYIAKPDDDLSFFKTHGKGRRRLWLCGIYKHN